MERELREKKMYVGRIEKLLAYYSPIPMCIVNSSGKVTRASSRIADVFKYDGIIDYDIFVLTGIKLPEFARAAQEEKPLYIQRNDKTFRISCSFLGEKSENPDENVSLPIIMTFSDITSYEKLKDLYNNERVYFMMVNVDNFDELLAGTSDGEEVRFTAELDQMIREWAAEMNAMIVKFKDNQYELAITQRNYEQLVKTDFPILEKVKKIEIDADFPVTLSIGIGMGGKTLEETDKYAIDALDMALGRGGDQAVAKNVRNLQYYGSGTTSVEKRNKGKSRLIGHALKTLICQSSVIFIMGHKKPDMDSFGAALGINRLAIQAGKESYILLGEYNESMTDMVADAKATGDCNFISEEKALALADSNALAVVVDTHRLMLVESTKLLDKVEKLAVIDHHRKAEDVIPNQSLSYMESYASSASELVAEILEHVIEKKTLSNMEANALLAGIMLDTNRFAVKAGVRTFETASWLKRNGADLPHVRRYFQDNQDSFRARAEGVANARIIDGTVAMSTCRGQTINTQMINSQVADELLTIKGIEASFVAGINECGDTVVSARSLGNINVQQVMENFGGGGHLNTAGLKTELTPDEILDEIEKYLHKSTTIGG